MSKYKDFKHHFWIPFGLALVIIVAGVIMTLTGQKSTGHIPGKQSGFQDFLLTGPAAIAIGVIVAIWLLFQKKDLL